MLEGNKLESECVIQFEAGSNILQPLGQWASPHHQQWLCDQYNAVMGEPTNLLSKHYWPLSSYSLEACTHPSKAFIRFRWQYSVTSLQTYPCTLGSTSIISSVSFLRYCLYTGGPFISVRINAPLSPFLLFLCPHCSPLWLSLPLLLTCWRLVIISQDTSSYPVHYHVQSVEIWICHACHMPAFLDLKDLTGKFHKLTQLFLQDWYMRTEHCKAYHDSLYLCLFYLSFLSFLSAVLWAPWPIFFTMVYWLGTGTLWQICSLSQGGGLSSISLVSSRSSTLPHPLHQSLWQPFVAQAHQVQCPLLLHLVWPRLVFCLKSTGVWPMVC
jgi:hypothetical protein